MNIRHADILAGDEREREHAESMLRDPTCNGLLMPTTYPRPTVDLRMPPAITRIWCCDGCGYEVAARGPDHPRYGEQDRRYGEPTHERSF